MVAAAVLWSSNGLFAKSQVFADWPLEVRGLTLAFWRNVFAVLIILPLVRRPQWDLRLVPMTISFTLMTVCFLQSMTLTTAANTIWLQSLSPLWVLVIGWFVFREGATRRDALLLVTGTLGVGLILGCELTQPTTASSGQSALGALLGVASGVCYSLVVLFMRRLRGLEGAWLVAINHGVGAVLLLPVIWLYAPWPSPWQFGVLAAFGSLQMAVPYLLFARGMRSISAHEGAALALIEPVLTPLWVWLAYREQPAWWTLVGGSMILGGLILRYTLRARGSSLVA